MYNYLLRIRYNGENYHGIAYQKGLKTISGEILDYFDIKNFKLSIVSRTDKGVNAEENYIVISTDKNIDFSNFQNNDIKILNVYKLKEYVNIRKFSTGKLYEYRLSKKLIDKKYKPKYLINSEKIIINSEEKEFDINKYIEGSKHFIGKKSFHNFAKGKVNNPICNIYKFEVKEENDYYINIIEGNRFLYEMIRRIITFLISVGSNLFPLELIDKVFEYKLDPKPFPADPRYLTLKKVYLDWNQLYKYIEDILL
ncbi:tRNA pseudouridine synthase A [Nanoarchaeota archaeon]